MISEKLAARDKQYQVHDLPHNDIFNEKKNIYAVLVDLGGTKSTNTLPCVLCSCLCPYLHQNMWKRSYWYEKLGLIYILYV